MDKDTRAPLQYVVLEKSLIGNEVFEAGQTCSYAGLPSENLKPTCDEGAARYQEYLDSNRARIAALQAANSDSAVGDPAGFAAQFAKALAEANNSQSAQIADAVAAALSAAQANQAGLIADAVAAALVRVFPDGTGKAAVKKASAADPIA